MPLGEKVKEKKPKTLEDRLFDLLIISVVIILPITSVIILLIYS